VIGWSTIRPALIEILTQISADTTRSREKYQAAWKDGPRGFIDTAQRLELLLKITSVVNIGEDETRREMIDGVFTETQVGQRKFVLQVQATVPSPEDLDSQNAFAATERIRSRIGRPRIIQRLLDAEISLHKCGAALPTPYKDKGRVVDCATVDITFGTVVNDQDPIPAHWIASVVVTSHASDVDGTQLEPPLQMVDEEISGTP
jgi:hypothetical protein